MQRLKSTNSSVEKNILRKTENFQLPLVNNLILIKKNTFLKFFNGKHRNLT
jgi:hypothetical protein